MALEKRLRQAERQIQLAQDVRNQKKQRLKDAKITVDTAWYNNELVRYNNWVVRQPFRTQVRMSYALIEEGAPLCDSFKACLHMVKLFHDQNP
jgi:hypothetical protein